MSCRILDDDEVMQMKMENTVCKRLSRISYPAWSSRQGFHWGEMSDEHREELDIKADLEAGNAPGCNMCNYKRKDNS
jgi:hypothetical protein